MNLRLKTIYFKYAPLLLLVIFSSIQFFLILRHKSPYLSDSYFYEHIFYQIKGNSYDQAHQKIVAQIDKKTLDKITKNIFTNPAAYKNSYTFFTKRPFYPFLAYFLNLFVPSIYFSFLIPVFSAYLGVIVVVYYFFQKILGKLLGFVSIGLFISFYPFLDWSTYFMTDTIGAFFWLFELFLVDRLLFDKEKNHTKWKIFFTISLVISLFNREQSLLMAPLLLTFLVCLKFFKFPKKDLNSIFHLLLISVAVAATYIVLAFILGQKNIMDTISYTQNDYGLYNHTFSYKENIAYILHSVKINHLAFIKDLTTHHWWFLVMFFSLLGLIKTIFLKNKPEALSLLIFSSGLASYLSIFIYPVLSYRYFFPVVFTAIFFSVKFAKEYFEVVQ